MVGAQSASCGAWFIMPPLGGGVVDHARHDSIPMVEPTRANGVSSETAAQAQARARRFRLAVAPSPANAIAPPKAALGSGTAVAARPLAPVVSRMAVLPMAGATLDV